MTGISKSDYDTNKDSYDTAFKGAVAGAIDGVEIEDVEITGVVCSANCPVPTRRLSTSTSSFFTSSVSSSSIAGGRVLAANDGIRISYRITVHQGTVTITQVTDGLTTATEDGSMNDYLKAVGPSLGLDNAFDDVIWEEPTVTFVVTSRHNDDDLTGAEVAGVVIGVVFGVALLVVLALFVVSWAATPTSIEAKGQEEQPATEMVDQA